MTNRIDSMNRSTGYVFDEMNQMVRIDYPDATQAVFDHDSNENLTARCKNECKGETSIKSSK